MGKRGFPKKPTAIEKLQGCPGRRPLPKNEPQPKKGAPKAPSWLSPKAKAAYRELAKLLESIQVITEADRHALELLCDSYSDYRDARQFVMERGQAYEHFDGRGHSQGWRTYPQVKIAHDAWGRVEKMLRQFGLTPSSRRDVERMEKKEKDPLEAFLEKPKLLKGGKK